MKRWVGTDRRYITLEDEWTEIHHSFTWATVAGLTNKSVVDFETGIVTVYSDDNVTPLYEGKMS